MSVCLCVPVRPLSLSLLPSTHLLPISMGLRACVLPDLCFEPCHFLPFRHPGTSSEMAVVLSSVRSFYISRPPCLLAEGSRDWLAPF